MIKYALILVLFSFLIPIARKLGVLTLAFYFFCRIEMVKKFRIYALPHNKGQIFDEAKSGTINFIMDIALLMGIYALGWIKIAKFSVLDSALTFLAVFVWFEFWFYFTHRLYHRKEFYFVHAHHHKSHVTSPWTAFSFSILERMSLNLGSIGFAIVMSHFMPITVAGFILFCLVSNVLNVLLHCNVEIFPAGFARNRYFGWIFTPTFHALHHARFEQHYGLFTTIPDRMFNTLWPDYAHVQERVARGQGLTTFHEKFVVTEPAREVSDADKTPSLVPNSEAVPSAS